MKHLVPRKLTAALLFLILPIVASAAPRGWGKSGTATTTNATLTAPFAPTDMCISNDGTADLIFDFTDGVATTADNSTNMTIKQGESFCQEFSEQKAVYSTFTIGVITASGTAAYRIQAWR
jgi:hypothetical protein